ncbi:hypothetical protein DVH05_015231 [Phytophthora capsici]|nr:hypothetical protein DVH05_015231 [Phytophthora capsici]
MSSAKGPYGDHHAPGDGISEGAASGNEVPDNKEKEIQCCCDQDGGGRIARSCGHSPVAIAKNASGAHFGSCGNNLGDGQAAETVAIMFNQCS